MYQQRINEIKKMISNELIEFEKICKFDRPTAAQKNLTKRKVEYYKKAILYLETNPKFEFIQSEIGRMMKQIDIRRDAQEQIKSNSNFTHRSKKELQEALSNADYKQQKQNLKMLQFCIQGIKISN
jgi:hypothetical protein